MWPDTRSAYRNQLLSYILAKNELENAILKRAYSQYNKDYTITSNKPIKKYTKLK